MIRKKTHDCIILCICMYIYAGKCVRIVSVSARSVYSCRMGIIINNINADDRINIRIQFVFCEACVYTTWCMCFSYAIMHSGITIFDKIDKKNRFWVW